ncbi:MAG TPA: hypothetical protein VF098_07425 [Sphingomicrobium sp.]|jgi:hypothetical protein
MRILSLFGLSPVLLCIAAAPASAPGQAVAQANSSAAQAVPAIGSSPAQAQERKICKQLPSSYSRLPNRACLTKKEWDEVQKELDQD